MIVIRSITHPPFSHQLIPGHEAIGRVVEKGKNVKDFEIGDRIVADVGTSVRTRHLAHLALLAHGDPPRM